MYISHFSELAGCHTTVHRVVSAFLQEKDVNTLAPGRYSLEDDCYVNVDVYDTRENVLFEAHRRYVDVQVMIDGEEEIFVAPLTNGREHTAYCAERDAAFYTCEDGEYGAVRLTKGMAAVLMPWDLHAPCNWLPPRQNRKLVFKIPVERIGREPRKVIACCGDSITFGLLASGRERSYPSVLGRCLGEAFRVENFGRNGATVIADYPLVPNRYAPYLKSPEYALAMVSGADAVVLMLGMNDGNPTHHFNADFGGPMTAEYQRIYRDTLTDLIRRIRQMPSRPKVFLALTTAMRRTVCAQFSEAYIRDFTNNVNEIRQIQRAVAQQTGAILIDTLRGMDDPAYYRDGCHLTDAGYERLAQIIAVPLKEEYQ